MIELKPDSIVYIDCVKKLYILCGKHPSYKDTYIVIDIGSTSEAIYVDAKEIFYVCSINKERKSSKQTTGLFGLYFYSEAYFIESVVKLIKLYCNYSTSSTNTSILMLRGELNMLGAIINMMLVGCSDELFIETMEEAKNKLNGEQQ